MKKFEYIEEVNIKKDRLNHLGLEGWELVSMISEHEGGNDFRPSRNFRIYTFKREVKE